MHLEGARLLTPRLFVGILYSMPYKQAVFANGEFYHIYNRGVEKRITFLDASDYRRFVLTIEYYRYKNPPTRFSFRNRQYLLKKVKDDRILVEIISYCLMPNHFHVLLKQVENGGITKFVSRLVNSYTKYFNTRRRRIGPLFQGSFKAIRIENDEQLLHVSRYVHLNPLIDFLTKDLCIYRFSSYPEFCCGKTGFCRSEYILNHFTKPLDYKKFVLDQEDYGRTIKEIERSLLEEL